MPSRLETIGLNATQKFIDTWNSRDPQQWAESLNYPHVRPSARGKITIFESPEAYVNNHDYQRVLDTGWERSAFDYKRVLHASADKVHVAGQWSRYDKNDAIILTTPVTYIVTCVDEHWGIQARFGTDHPGDADTTELEQVARKRIEDFASAISFDDRATGASLLNYPFINVGVGTVAATASAEDFALPTKERVSITSMMAAQAGQFAINFALELGLESGRSIRAVVLVTKRDERVGIQAMSLLSPSP